jgi:hypothetical protein
MGKISKIIFVLCAFMAFCFAQVADSSSQSTKVQDSIQLSGNASIPSITIPTGVITPKKPTNWSKIKDLFL